MSKRKRDYDRYLQSAHWHRLRKLVWDRDGWACRNCGSNHQLQCHHARYRADLRLCTADDLVTLCKPCHEAHHKRQRKERREQRKLRPRRPRIDPATSSLFRLIAEVDAE